MIFEKCTAYQPMQTTTTTWPGWQIVNPRCYMCANCIICGGIPTCQCVSRTFKRGLQGDECLSYVDRDSRLAECLRGDV